jgi:hypothetical protein
MSTCLRRSLPPAPLRVTPRVPASTLVVLLALGLLTACGGKSPPTPPAGVPPLALSVVDETGNVRTLTIERALVPDFSEDEHRAWRVARLFEGELGDGPARLEVDLEVDGKRSSGLVDPYRDTDELIWVVRWNRSAQVVLDNVDPEDPFPTRHGRGGNRGRRGTSLRGVTALRLVKTTTTAPGENMQGLTLVIDGSTQVLSLEALAAVSSLDILGDSGKGTRDAWSLRTLATEHVGAGARVTALRGDGEREVEIPAAAWNDLTRTPVIRLNRRGQFKFHWADEKLTPLEGEELRNISALVISTGN